MHRRPTIRSAKKIISRIQPHLPFPVDEIIDCTEVVEYSNINFVFRIRVRSCGRIIVCFLKIAHPYLARVLRPPFDFAPVRYPRQRITIEVDVLQKLARLWGNGVVPSVYYSDPRRGIALLGDVGQGGRLLIREFQYNRAHPEIAPILGRLMGRMHGSTYGTKEQWCSDAAWRKESTGYIHKRIAGSIIPYVGKKPLRLFFQEVQSAPQALAWTDPIFRNMFVKPNGRVSCIDFDVAQTFDPAYDIGLITAHWKWMELKGIVRVCCDAQKFLRDFFNSYQRTLAQYGISRHDRITILNRAQKWMGMYLVYRSDHAVDRFFDGVNGWGKRVGEEGVRLFTKQNIA